MSAWSENLNPFADKHVVADAKNPAVEVACIWQPGEGRNDQGIPTRGFSGQVFFFTGRDSEPAVVDGDVRVYLFADRGTPEERAKPLRQFDFSPEAWATHVTNTSLGPGYAVFIPYPEDEPYQVRCQLRARFSPKAGPVIWSEAVTMTLEGPPRPGNEPLSMAGHDPDVPSLPTVVDAELSHRVVPASDRQQRPRRLRTDTFRLGEIERTAYEVPRREDEVSQDDESRTVTLDDFDAATLKQMLRETGKRKPAGSHPLTSEPRRGGPAEAHPLRSSASARSRPPFPADEEAMSPEDEEPSPVTEQPYRAGPARLARRHPLAKPSFARPSDATFVRGDRHPLTGLPPARRNGARLTGADETAPAEFDPWRADDE